MDETESKKRRNLMITCTAVPASAFLGLQLPGSTILGTISNDLLVEDPWRFWVVILLVLVYQYWRFITDRNVQETWPSIKQNLEATLAKVIENRISQAVMRKLQNRCMCGYSVELLGEIQKPQLIDWSKSEFSPEITYLHGKALPSTERFKRSRQASMRYVITYEEGKNIAADTMDIRYELPKFNFATYAVVALAKTLYKTQELQDLAIPTLLTSSSLCIILWNILCSG